MAVVLGAALIGSGTPVAVAEPPLPGLNGRYLAVTDGTEGFKNDVLYLQPSITATWTVNTVCDVTECTGRVFSDQGWSSDIWMSNGRWTVYVVDSKDAVTCPGDPVNTPLPTRQRFSFDAISMAGDEQRFAPSGECNELEPINLRRLFLLTKAA